MELGPRGDLYITTWGSDFFAPESSSLHRVSDGFATYVRFRFGRINIDIIFETRVVFLSSNVFDFDG